MLGESIVDAPLPATESPSHDRFGRPFETSRFQWLPTPFQVTADGRTTIASYINNLDSARHPEASSNLAALFGTALPLLENVMGYVQSTMFWTDDCKSFEHEGELPAPEVRTQAVAPSANLRGRKLQVIPKIVEYRLGAGETHEGVWHVEGMSHEHIVAICIYILDRDEALEGGELRFRRAYTVEEAGALFWGIDQIRPRPIEALVGAALSPRDRSLRRQGAFSCSPIRTSTS